VTALPHLSGSEMIGALDALQLNQTQFAKILDVGRTTVYRWCKPGARAPGYVSILVRMLLAAPEIRTLLVIPDRPARGRPSKVHPKEGRAA
jgi:hypothetical protein